MEQNQQFAQEYRPESKKSAKLLWGAGIFLIIATIFVYVVYVPRYRRLEMVEIFPGMGSRKIGELLKSEGVIGSKWIFVTYVSLIGRATDLKPGEYKFDNNLSLAEIVDDLVRGGARERTITIPEGWSIKEMGEYFEKENVLFRADFEKVVGIGGARSLSGRFEFLRSAPESSGLEGYLFPDTYRIFVGSSAEEIIGKMLENFDKKIILELREETSHQKKTLFEIITVASLIEKEVVSDEDRAMVSGILWKRLAVGIPLQVDATIIYITGKKSIRVSREETQIDSLYNTYKYRGLPPGPISNPGLSAIRAAIYPKDSSYLYYLSAPDGRTIFSKTLEEHNFAKAKYLRN